MTKELPNIEEQLQKTPEQEKEQQEITKIAEEIEEKRRSGEITQNDIIEELAAKHLKRDSEEGQKAIKDLNLRMAERIYRRIEIEKEEKLEQDNKEEEARGGALSDELQQESVSLPKEIIEITKEEKKIEVKKLKPLLNKLWKIHKEQERLDDELLEFMAQYTLKEIPKKEEYEDGYADSIARQKENLQTLFLDLYGQLDRLLGSEDSYIFNNLEGGDVEEVKKVFTKFFKEKIISNKIDVKTEKYHYGEMAKGHIYVDGEPVIPIWVNVDDGGGRAYMDDQINLRIAFTKLALKAGVKPIEE